jgi:hypothetical protein
LQNWVSRAGKAEVTYDNGCTYKGDFNSEKQKHGSGVYTWMVADEESGEMKTVATYDGAYADGKKNGLGKMTFPNGDEYHGEWKDNKMEGEGTYKYAATKDIYSGSWVAGIKSGQGVYEYGADKSKLSGTWEDGVFTTGEWILEGCGKYKGAFANGKPAGAGSFEFASGITQSGEYVVKAVEEGEEPSEEPPTWAGAPVFSTVKA